MIGCVEVDDKEQRWSGSKWKTLVVGSENSTEKRADKSAGRKRENPRFRGETGCRSIREEKKFVV